MAWVLTTLKAVAISSSATMDAPAAMLAAKGFGVGHGFAVLVGIFAVMFALMVLGGHLRAASQRRRSQKRP
jgi:Na+/pantothenate symporter